VFPGTGDAVSEWQEEKIRRFSRTDSPWIVRVFPGTGDAVSDRAGENLVRYAVRGIQMLGRGYP
jgi:hypothetical protein